MSEIKVSTTYHIMDLVHDKDEFIQEKDQLVGARVTRVDYYPKDAHGVVHLSVSFDNGRSLDVFHYTVKDSVSLCRKEERAS